MKIPSIVTNKTYEFYEEKLEEENNAFRRFNDAPVYPSAASIDSVKSNEMAWGAWYDAAKVCISLGDADGARSCLRSIQSGSPSFRADEVSRLLASLR
jgi:Tfp pilus assembly protein FimV